MQNTSLTLDSRQSYLLNLSKASRKVLKIITSFSHRYGSMKAGVGWISKQAAVTERQVRRILKDFRENGVVDFILRPGKKTIYSIKEWVMGVIESIKKMWADKKKSYAQKAVDNQGLQTGHEHKNVTPLSPLSLGENSDSIHIDPLINKDECLLSEAPTRSASEMEKEMWRCSGAYEILYHQLGAIAWHFDVNALKRIYSLTCKEAVDIAIQFDFVRKQKKGYVETPSKLLTCLVNRFLAKKRYPSTPSMIPTQKASKAETELLQRLEILHQYELTAKQGYDDYHVIQDSCWRYHVNGTRVCFRNLDTDDYLEICATSPKFEENLKNQWDKINKKCKN